MINVSIELQPTLPELGSELMDDVQDIAAQTLKSLVRRAPEEMRRLMTFSSASGRLYRRSSTAGGANRFYRASAPGQPPGIDSGSLVKSLRGRMTGTLTGEIEMNDYGLLLDEKRNRKFIDRAVETVLIEAVPNL